jgi:tripartite-type tricarboxylate transporter receptor subunit TctC
MKIPRRRLERFARPLHVAAAAAVLVGLSIAFSNGAAQAQSARTIKIVVPFPPGGGVDAVARVLAEQVGRDGGPPMVIENRPGAGTAIGADAVLRAPPDGNTVFMVNNSFVVVPHIRKLDYDPLTSFVSICNLAITPTLIVVNSESPYRTLADLVGAARARPGEVTIGTAPGTVLNVALEMLERAADVRMTFVPFPGTPPAVNALLGGHVTAALIDYPAGAGQLQAGKLRALATGSPKRIEWLRDVPTVAESGYAGYDVELWYGLFASAKVPKETISQLEGWFTKASQAPDIRSRLVAQGITPVGACGAGFAAYIRRQFDDYGRIIREASIKAE